MGRQEIFVEVGAPDSVALSTEKVAIGKRDERVDKIIP